MVVHLSSGNTPPPVSAVGITRLERLIEAAEAMRVRLAFENMRIAEYTRYALDNCDSSFVGFCYDTGHENFWTRDINWLSLYGNRLFAVHLHDNNGETDAHLLPFDGNIDWQIIAKALPLSAYNGCTALECEFNPKGPYGAMSIEDFLKVAFERGKRLNKMISG